MYMCSNRSSLLVRPASTPLACSTATLFIRRTCSEAMTVFLLIASLPRRNYRYTVRIQTYRLCCECSNWTVTVLDVRSSHEAKGPLEYIPRCRTVSFPYGDAPTQINEPMLMTYRPLSLGVMATIMAFVRSASAMESNIKQRSNFGRGQEALSVN